MSSDATDAGLETPDDIAAAPREKPRLRVTVASDTKSVEMWVRPTASCDLLRARVAPGKGYTARLPVAPLLAHTARSI